MSHTSGSPFSCGNLITSAKSVASLIFALVNFALNYYIMSCVTSLTVTC